MDYKTLAHQVLGASFINSPLPLPPSGNPLTYRQAIVHRLGRGLAVIDGELSMASPADTVANNQDTKSAQGMEPTLLVLDKDGIDSPTLHQPVMQEIRISTTPDVFPGTELWISPSIELAIAHPQSIQKITLGPFSQKYSLPMSSATEWDYRIAAVLESEEAPPEIEGGRWRSHYKRKLIVNGLLLKNLMH